MAKGPDAFRTISEAAAELGVAQHVLRFWETRFSFIQPLKRAGGRRFYRPQDIVILSAVRVLLHEHRLGISAVQALHRTQGVKGLLRSAGGHSPAPGARSAPPLESMQSGPGARASRLGGLLAELEGVKSRIDRLLAPASDEFCALPGPGEAPISAR